MLFSSFCEVILNNEAGSQWKFYELAFDSIPLPDSLRQSTTTTTKARCGGCPVLPGVWKWKMTMLGKRREAYCEQREVCGEVWVLRKQPSLLLLHSKFNRDGRTDDKHHATQGSAVLGINTQLIQLSANLFSCLTTLNICYLLNIHIWYLNTFAVWFSKKLILKYL